MITRHPDFEALSALADGSLDARRAATVARHAEACPRCAARLAAVRALLAQARALPDAVEPPTGLWDDVRGALHAPRGVEPAPRRAMHWTAWRLAAAALLVAGLSSAVTHVVTRPAARDVPVVATGIDRPGSVAATDADYAATTDELQRAVAEQRTRLAPETIAKVERSLRVVDSAIAEARHALAADPGNQLLVEILAANYEHKLQLLRRAAELPASL